MLEPVTLLRKFLNYGSVKLYSTGPWPRPFSKASIIFCSDWLNQVFDPGFVLQVVDLYAWNGHLASLKAAAAVYAALLIPISNNDQCELVPPIRKVREDPWTPTLKYYTAYEVNDLVTIAD